MFSIILDTGIFVVPPHANSETEVHELLEKLVHWSKVVEGGAPIRVYKLSDLEQTLCLCRCWPVHPDLETLLSMYGLDSVFSANDVLRVYFSLMARAIDCSEQGIEVASCNEIRLAPNLLHGRAPTLAVEHSKLVYATSGLSATFDPGRVMPVASGLPQTGPKVLRVEASVARVRGLHVERLSLPFSLEQNIVLLGRLEDLASCIAPLTIWEAAETIEDSFLALCIGSLALLGRREAAFEDIPPFAIGSRFRASLENAQAAPGQPYSSVVFESCWGLSGIPCMA